MKNDYDAPEGESFDEIYQSDGLRWMSVVVVLLVVFGFFSLAWYAYRTTTEPTLEEGEVLTVEADESPYKERPQDPGGMQFPHQDKEVYNRLVTGEVGGERVERLLPAPEEPMSERQIAEDEEAPETWINQKLHHNETVEVLEDTGVAAAEDAAADNTPAASTPAADVEAAPAQADAAQADAPAEQRSAEVKAQEEVPAYVPPKPVVKPWIPKAEEKKVTAAPVEQVEEKPLTPADDPIVAQAEKFVQEKAEKLTSPPAPVKAVQPPAAVSTAGGVEVQLAALRSRAEADSVWQKLAVKHGDVLAGKAHRIVQVEIPGKGTYYRLRVSAGSAAAAKSLCASLSSRNQPCMVTR